MPEERQDHGKTKNREEFQNGYTTTNKEIDWSDMIKEQKKLRKDNEKLQGKTCVDI